MLYPLSLLPTPCNLKPTNAGAQRHPPVILAHMRQEDQPGLHNERPSRQKIDQALVCFSEVTYSEPIGLWIRLPDPLLGGCFLSQCLSIRKAKALKDPLISVSLAYPPALPHQVGGDYLWQIWHPSALTVRPLGVRVVEDDVFHQDGQRSQDERSKQVHVDVISCAMQFSARKNTRCLPSRKSGWKGTPDLSLGCLSLETEVHTQAAGLGAPTSLCLTLPICEMGPLSCSLDNMFGMPGHADMAFPYFHIFPYFSWLTCKGGQLTVTFSN